MRVFIAGVDGYLGWSLAMYLVKRGHEVGGADCYHRRDWVAEMGSQSATPIKRMTERLQAFRENFGTNLWFIRGDMTDYNFVWNFFRAFEPEAIVHFAEMPSAPYMIDVHHCAFTHTNNLLGTINVLHCMRDVCPEAHLVKLGCYDDKTEVLTRDGWKLFKDLTYQDEICCLDGKTEEIQYCRPKNVVEYPYNGQMLKIKNKSLDLVITPNHRVVFKRGVGKDVEIKKATEIFNKRIWIPRSGKWEGEYVPYFYLPIKDYRRNSGGLRDKARELTKRGVPFNVKDLIRKIGFSSLKDYKKKYTQLRRYINHEQSNPQPETIRLKMDDWLEFLGYIISEGGVYEDRRVYFAQNEGEVLNKMINVCERLRFTHYVDTSQTCRKVFIDNVSLARYLKRLGYCHQKYIPREFKNLSKRQLKILFDALMSGDGHYYPNGRYRSYSSKSKQLIDDIQEIALKLGIRATIGKKSNKGVYYLNFGYSIDTEVIPDKKRVSGEPTYEWIPYRGKVFCCTVPSGIIFVRRNGKAAWYGGVRDTKRGYPGGVF